MVVALGKAARTPPAETEKENAAMVDESERGVEAGSRVEGGGQAGLEEQAVVGGDGEDEASTSTLY